MNFINSYFELGDEFYEQCEPVPVSNPSTFLWNKSLAEELGVTEDMQQAPQDLALVYSGNQVPKTAKPIAMAYSGHQFGYFNPTLGDGRAHLLGDLKTASGQLLDIQLKGSGVTPYSRGGDGRCALGPAIREYVMSEAMAALGVPTTRCLAVVTTGEPVYRDNVLPGAVVTRVASSHIRVGTFEYFRSRQNPEGIKKLADYVIQRHYNDLESLKGDQRYLALIKAVLTKQIELVCHWMRIGFIHGVMNTDNTSIAGETIDYGPCAMMGIYDPQTVFSSIDTQGRYCFGNQPAIAQWNIARFAECLLHLIDADEEKAIEKVTPIINGFSDQFKRNYIKMMAGKLGLLEFKDDDEKLISNVLRQLQNAQLDYTITFDLLTRSFSSPAIESEIKTDLGEVFAQWKQRVSLQSVPVQKISESMRHHNPVVIPRNHHVEAMLEECIETGKPDAALAFLKVLNSPYKEIEGTTKYQDPANDSDEGYQTFCGT